MDSFKIKCPKCSQRLVVSRAMSGKVATCSACKSKLKVPALPGTPVDSKATTVPAETSSSTARRKPRTKSGHTQPADRSQSAPPPSDSGDVSQDETNKSKRPVPWLRIILGLFVVAVLCFGGFAVYVGHTVTNTVLSTASDLKSELEAELESGLAELSGSSRSTPVLEPDEPTSDQQVSADEDDLELEGNETDADESSNSAPDEPPPFEFRGLPLGSRSRQVRAQFPGFRRGKILGSQHQDVPGESFGYVSNQEYAGERNCRVSFAFWRDKLYQIVVVFDDGLALVSDVFEQKYGEPNVPMLLGHGWTNERYAIYVRLGQVEFVDKQALDEINQQRNQAAAEDL